MQPYFWLCHVLCNCVHTYKVFDVLHLYSMSDTADHCELSAVVSVPVYNVLLIVLLVLVVREVWLSFAKGRGNPACYDVVSSTILCWLPSTRGSACYAQGQRVAQFFELGLRREEAPPQAVCRSTRLW